MLPPVFVMFYTWILHAGRTIDHVVALKTLQNLWPESVEFFPSLAEYVAVMNKPRISTTATTTTKGPPYAWRPSNLEIGAEVDVYCISGKAWYHGIVLKHHPNGSQVLVHFLEWEHKWDVWMDETSELLAAHLTHTKRVNVRSCDW